MKGCENFFLIDEDVMYNGVSVFFVGTLSSVETSGSNGFGMPPSDEDDRNPAFSAVEILHKNHNDIARMHGILITRHLDMQKVTNLQNGQMEGRWLTPP